jgi:TRIAP1/MDM35 family protein
MYKPSGTNNDDISPCSMSQSLSKECTPLKQAYDTCFNSWFEGYLEPAVAASSSPEARTEYSKRKAEEFQEKCGKIWESYRSCVQVCIHLFSIGILYELILSYRKQ